MIAEKYRTQLLNGSLTDNNTFLSGMYKGYYITMQQVNTVYFIKINASSETDLNNVNLNAFLQQQQASNKRITNITVYKNSFSFSLQMPNLAKNIPATVNEAVDPIINYLLGAAYISGCANCGTSTEPVSCYEINGGYNYICPTCANDISNELQANQQDILVRKSNLPAGLVGAFLGSLLGCIVWLLIYKLGYIAGIAGAVTGVCAMKGYEMFGKQLDKKGVIASVIIMVVMIFFANKTAWSWEAYDALKEYNYTFFDCYRYLDEILADSGLTGSYYGDLIIGYLLTLIASFSSVVNAFKASAGSYSIKKIG